MQKYGKSLTYGEIFPNFINFAEKINFIYEIFGIAFHNSMC